MNFFNNGGHGCDNFDRGGCGCDPCNILLWIILLNGLCGCGNNNGCNIDCCTLIILLLLCGGCGNK